MEGPSFFISILAIISTVSTQATAATAHDIVFLGPGDGLLGKSEIYAIKTLSSTDTCQIPNYPITGDIHGMIGFTSSSGVTLCGGYSTVYHSECHTLNNQSWTVTEGMITERQYAASSHLLDNSVFVSGGWSNNGRLSSTEILVDGIWREGPTMPTPLSRHCMVSSADTVYIFGGYDGSAFTNKSMKRSGQGQFTSIANLNIGRSNHGCAVVGNQVYIVGGFDSNRDILSSVEIYNTNKNTHKAGPMLPKAVQGPTAISYKTSIMVFGGYSSDGYESKVYRLIDNRWNEVGEMKHPRAWFPAIIVNKDVICGGGELVVDDIGNVGDIETGHAGGDPEYCHLVDCSLPTSSSFCPIKCAVDPTFCRVIDCSLPQSRTLCPRSCSKSDINFYEFNVDGYLTCQSLSDCPPKSSCKIHNLDLVCFKCENDTSECLNEAAGGEPLKNIAALAGQGLLKILKNAETNTCPVGYCLRQRNKCCTVYWHPSGFFGCPGYC